MNTFLSVLTALAQVVATGAVLFIIASLVGRWLESKHKDYPLGKRRGDRW